MERQMYESWIQGQFLKAHRYFGAHHFERDGKCFYSFRVYAPSARNVRVKGSFSDWEEIVLSWTDGGIWEVVIEGVQLGDEYKYCIETHEGIWYEKTDPFAFYACQHPTFNTIVYDDQYIWCDATWMKARQEWKMEQSPLLIYEVHLGSWQKTLENTFLNYTEIATRLVDYVKETGFTHIELLPVMEHPYLGSWGYQQTGLFAATSRYGTPEDLKYFIDYAHQQGIGVIIDFVPVHFCKDMHGLQTFDGTNLYEYSDDRRENSGWGTHNFDLGKGDVQSLLLSAIDYWITNFHVDGIRFDAVSHLIYRNGMKQDGMNEEGQSFIRHMNGMLELHYPDVLRIAEDSSDFSGVTTRTNQGGLGFHLKWDLGFANDHFQFMATPYEMRKERSEKITFARVYHDDEHFLLPYSHDEVVHQKGSMLMKQQGDITQKFAALAVEYAFWICHPGKKLLFMGQEFGQQKEWNEIYSLDWHLLEESAHQAFYEEAKRLFHCYQQERALYANDFTLTQDFKWNVIDAVHTIYAFTRKIEEEEITALFHFGTEPYFQYQLPLKQGNYIDVLRGEIIYTDATGKASIDIPGLSYRILKFGGNK